MMILKPPPENELNNYIAAQDPDEIVRLARSGLVCCYMDLVSMTYYFRKEVVNDE